VTTVSADIFAPLVLQGHGPIVVQFMSHGCAHCRAIEPVLSDVAAQSEARFFRINNTVDRNLAREYGIAATPTFVLFLSGKEIGRVERPQPVALSLATLLAEPFST